MQKVRAGSGERDLVKRRVWEIFEKGYSLKRVYCLFSEIIVL